jgi:hypothetical protein
MAHAILNRSIHMNSENRTLSIKQKFITALTKKYFDGKLFEKEKVIIPEELETNFVKFAYKRLKKAA